jgi:hypothetical protein
MPQFGYLLNERWGWIRAMPTSRITTGATLKVANFSKHRQLRDWIDIGMITLRTSALMEFLS